MYTHIYILIYIHTRIFVTCIPVSIIYIRKHTALALSNGEKAVRDIVHIHIIHIYTYTDIYIYTYIYIYIHTCE